MVHGTYGEDVTVGKNLNLGAVGGTVTMTSLSLDSGKTVGLAGGFAADGSASTVFDLSGAVTLTDDVTITSTNNKDITFGSTVDGSRKSWELSQEYENIYAAIGIHPHDADSFSDKDEIILRELAGKDKVVAIGETGLDYFKNYSASANQRKLFSSLISLAKDFNFGGISRIWMFAALRGYYPSMLAM